MRAFKKMDPKEAARLYQQGLSFRECAKALGVSSSTVRAALKQLKIVSRPVGDVDGKGGWGAWRRKMFCKETAWK